MGKSSDSEAVVDWGNKTQQKKIRMDVDIKTMIS